MHNNRYDFGESFKKHNTLNMRMFKKGVYVLEISTDDEVRKSRIIKE